MRETFIEWYRLKPELIGAAIAFYIIFSLGPILVIVISIVGLIFGDEAVEGQIVQEINNIVGQKAAQVMQILISRAYSPPTQTISTIVSVPLVFFGATMIFFQLKNTLNHIWGIRSKSRNRIIGFLKTYLFSFTMVIILGSLLFLLVVKSLTISLLRELFYPFPRYALQSLDFIFSLGVLTLLFGMIYDLLPDVKIRVRDIWIGAGVTSLMFSTVQFLIGMYLGYAHIDSAYGAIGSITILLIWIFYSSQIFLLGAVFTKVYACKSGKPLIPKQIHKG
ncbi:YihY/virulence factor BrkB family protein [bacterium]|nr:YihY/virulence factor BrkB family protein [bacterium]